MLGGHWQQEFLLEGQVLVPLKAQKHLIPQQQVPLEYDRLLGEDIE
jgi:hypothetical protein